MLRVALLFCSKLSTLDNYYRRVSPLPYLWSPPALGFLTSYMDSAD